MKALELNVMEMNELEIKGVLHGLIQKARSKQKLLLVFNAVKAALADDDTSDGWSDLTVEQQKKLEYAIAQSYDPSQSVSYEDGLKMIDTWLTK